jgi:FixJ family two-component response regulator
MEKRSELICIIDDDSSVRRALGRMIRSFGFDTQLLASARECLDGPYVDRAACLVVDITMPEMDGFELHALLVASGRNVPTVFISGQNNPKNISKAQKAGGIAYLDKPCDPNELQAAINLATAS